MAAAAESPFEVVSESEDGLELVFRIRDVDLSIVNGLRRTLLADVPIAAIKFLPSEPLNENVTFVANTCCLNNEFVGQRLSMVPLCFSPEELDTFNHTDYKFVIRAKNKGVETLDVTTRDFRILNQDGVQYPDAFHARIFPPSKATGDHILLTKLKPNHYDRASGEELHVEAYAAVGTAKEWAGFSVVSLATFENAVDEELASKMLDAKLADLRTKYDGMGISDKLTDEKVAEVTHDFRHLDRYRYFKTNRHGDPNEFVFSMESTCGMACRLLVRKALTIMASKLEQIGNGNVPIETTKAAAGGGGPSDLAMFTSIIPRANHTHGSIVQSRIYDVCVRGISRQQPGAAAAAGGTGAVAAFVGYNMPHPLEEKVALRYTLRGGSASPTGGTSVEEATAFVRGHAAAVRDEIVALRERWEELGRP